MWVPITQINGAGGRGGREGEAGVIGLIGGESKMEEKDMQEQEASRHPSCEFASWEEQQEEDV